MSIKYLNDDIGMWVEVDECDECLSPIYDVDSHTKSCPGKPPRKTRAPQVSVFNSYWDDGVDDFIEETQ